MSLCLLVSIFLSQCASIFANAAPRVDPLVDSKVGLIKGLRAADGDYSMFLGIPYAKVDENNLFGDSVPHPPFEDTFKAYDDTAICPQLEAFNKTIVGTLDCLHLSIFVPTEATSSNRLPVLVWIHGGGFIYGFYGRYIYGPKFLVRHGVVLVSINYRLGPYGFMCPDIPEVPGNQGLKDQVIALRWIKENIEAFGGDSNRITVFGESAGAIAVDFHLYSTRENLFHKAILQSGVSPSPAIMKNPGVEGPLKLARHLGLITDDVKRALSFLATVDTGLVIAAAKELSLTFMVCVEKNFDNVESFVKDYPDNLNVPKAKNIPILIGFNNDEGLMYSNANLEDSNFIGHTINDSFDMDSQTFDEMSEILRNFYFGDNDMIVTNNVSGNTSRPVMNMASDFIFLHPTQRSLRKYFNGGAQTIFSYMFSYVGERNYGKYTYNYAINIGGASHADEISYLFDVSYMKSVMSEEDQIIVDRMTTLWTNFVKYGDPTPETTELLPVKWSPANKDHWNYLNIDSELSMKTRPFSERMAFLDLFFKINEKYQIGYRPDSIPYAPFEETFEAFDDTAICPQVEEFNNTIVGTLDCLHLSVFVPTEATSSNRLPVLIWIHGGGLNYGFYGRYLYGPKFLIRHGVVLVSINYRLGPYGFMCPDIPEVPGNQGLKDQVIALRWIKENIEAFGGDSNRITVFGESAGAMSVDFHLYSTKEKLFNKAILQSGVGLSPAIMKNPGTEGPLKLARHLGLNTDDVKEALSFLATIDTGLVIAATKDLDLGFIVCVENNYDNVESFLNDYPVNLNVPKVKNIPLLIGFNNDEGLMYVNADLEGSEFIENTINDSFDMESQTFDEMSEILRNFYFGDNDVNEDTKHQVMNLAADFMFIHPAQRSIRKYFNDGAQTIFSYMFSYVGERNFVKYNHGITIGGASHADEISYLFDVSYMKSVMPEEDQIIVDRMTTLWTNFVKFGDPTPETTELLPVKWSSSTKDYWFYLNIDSELSMKTRPFSERMAFLDLFYKINEKQQIGYRTIE